MFCKNCGSQIEDGSIFCPSCGARVVDQPDPTPAQNYYDAAPAPEPAFDAAPAPEPAASKKKLPIGALIGIIGGGVALVALALVLILVLCTRSWEATVNQLFDAVCELDAEKIVDLSVPDKVMKVLEENNDSTKEEMIEEMQDDLDEVKDLKSVKEFRKSAKMKIKDHENLKKREIKQLNESYDDRYDTGDNFISDAMTVTVRITYSSTSKTLDLRLIKVGAKWYLDTAQLYDILRYFR